MKSKLAQSNSITYQMTAFSPSDGGVGPINRIPADGGGGPCNRAPSDGGVGPI